MLLRTVLLWALILLGESIAVILLVPPKVIVNAASKEEATLVATIGEESAALISSAAAEAFNTMFVETGIMEESFTLLVPSEANKRQSKGLETLAEGVFEVVRHRMEALWNLVFVALQRLYAFLHWLPLLLPLLIAATFDGATLRKIKLLTFGISSAPIYGASVHALIVLAFFPLLYAAWPFPAPPMIVPIWFFALAMVMRLLVANLHRM